jgi:hypothetical protein
MTAAHSKSTAKIHSPRRNPRVGTAQEGMPSVKQAPAAILAGPRAP